MADRNVPAFLDRIRETIRRHRMTMPGDRVAVGVSGGPDSIALLAALVELAPELDLEIGALHFHHRLRVEADLDQQCAEAVAAALGVPCRTGFAEPLLPGGNLEERAREERYAFFDRAAAADGWTRIATAHTADDQAETVLLRLLRGAGSTGLAGIPPVRGGTIVRPLLECRRAQVLDFLEKRGLPYRTDASNADPRHLRNRVRHEVLPLLESINPQAREALLRTSRTQAADGAFLDAAAAALLPPGVDAGALEVARVLGADPALQVRAVREWLRRARGDLRRIEAAHLDAILALVTGPRSTGIACLPGGACVVREYGQLRFVQSMPPLNAEEGVGTIWPGSSLNFDTRWSFTMALLCGDGARWRRPEGLWECLLDAEQLRGPFRVRRVRPGDRVRPFGMRGQRKLQDVFVDRKVPPLRRWTLPVVEARGRVLWVPGVVRSADAAVTDGTRSACRICVHEHAIAAP